MLKGRAWRYGANLNTDVIIPGRYCHLTDEKELAKHCMEDIDTSFAGGVKPGDILVGENNFGCGSSRELAPISIKAAGISCVIASSFARIFYRNCVNQALPIVESADAVADVQKGDSLEVDLEKGTVKNCRSSKTFKFQPLPPFLLEIMNAGGLIPKLKEIAKNMR